jgi:hypothetical protein
MSIYENNLRITSFTETSSVGGSYLIPIVDVSDTTMSSTGTTKKITYSSLFGQIDTDLDLAIVAKTGQYSDLGGKPVAGVDFLTPTSDGSGLTNVNASTVKNFGLSGYAGTIGKPLSGFPSSAVLSVYANDFYGNFHGNGSDLSSVSAEVAYNVAPSGLSAYQGTIGSATTDSSVKFHGSFFGDASGLYNLPTSGAGSGFIYKLSLGGTSIYPDLNNNDADYSTYSFLGNGLNNILIGSKSFIGAGEGNILSSVNYAVIVNGVNNGSDSNYIFIGNGSNNQIIGSPYAGILNGENNLIENKPNTFIIGSNITAPLSNYTYFNNVSSQGTVASNYIQSNGGFIDGDLTISGSITALGSATYQNTVFTTTSALSIINTGQFGPALYVEQAGGFGDVASFYDADGIEVLHVGNGLYPDGEGLTHETGIVGIMTSAPNKTLTVSGEISASSHIYTGGILYTSGHSSLEWDSVYNTVSSSSATWDLVITLSGQIDDAYNTLSSNSGRWEDSYNALVSTSSNWDDSYLNLAANSGKWEDSYNTLTTTSGIWDTAYNTLTSTSGIWDSSYNTLTSTSSNWDTSYNTLTSTSGIWDSSYTTLTTYSGNWESVFDTVQSLSTNWDQVYFDVLSSRDDWYSVYNTVNSTSSYWNNIYNIFGNVSGKYESTYTTLCTNSAYWDFIADVVDVNYTDWNQAYIVSHDQNTDAGTVSASFKINLNGINGITLSSVGSQLGILNLGATNLIDVRVKDLILEGGVKSTGGKNYSSGWESTYTTVSSYSAAWSGGSTSLVAESADWESCYNTVSTNSANWNSTYSVVTAASAKWATTTTRLTAEIGDNSSTYFVVSHNLGTGYVLVQVYNNSTKEIVYPTIKYVNNNQIGLTFNYVIPSASHTVLIVG